MTEDRDVPTPREKKRRLSEIAGLALSALLFIVAVWFLVHTVRKYEAMHILSSLRAISSWRLIAACLLSGLSYVSLTLYDILALRHLNHPLPLKHAMLVSFVAHAFSNNIGVTMLSGGSLRLRMYSSLGMEVGDILRLIAFCNLTFIIGFVAMGGILLSVLPAFALHPMPLTGTSMQIIGVVMLLCSFAYLFVASRRGSVRISGYNVSLPSLSMSLAQIVAASLDWIITGLILFVLLPPGSVPFGIFIGIFLAAHVAGIVSNIPGGLGVFEATLLLLLGPFVQEPVLLGAIFLYRIVYYLLPLAVSVVMFGIHEARAKDVHWTKVLRGAARDAR